MGGAGFPPCWLFCLRQPNTGAYPCSLVGSMADSGRAHAKENPPGPPPPASPSPRRNRATTRPHRRPPNTSRHVRPSLPQGHRPPPGSRCTHPPVCALQEWVPCPHQSRHSPATNPPQTSKSDPPGTPPPPPPDPQAGKPDVGPRTPTPVGGPPWYKCSPVCESPTQQLWDLILL